MLNFFTFPTSIGKISSWSHLAIWGNISFWAKLSAMPWISFWSSDRPELTGGKEKKHIQNNNTGKVERQALDQLLVLCQTGTDCRKGKKHVQNKYWQS